MLLSDDMRELLRLFRHLGVQYVVVGGFAVNYYGYVRTTQDIDVLVNPTGDNAGRVMGALAEFGFAGAGIPPELFEREGAIIHLGVEPNRIDILTSLKGIDNDDVFAGAQVVEIDGENVNLISLDHLIQAKSSSDRPRDRADADELARVRDARSET
jgi:predicted nucleotidyltransferase